jgi:NADP-dependent 3-hydroxy acid dehydrogenase YdfG
MKKLIVITGASSGLGEAMARRFSSDGHPLLLIARRVEKLQDLNLPDTICAKVDITNRKDFDTAIESAVRAYGPVDLLINNAGVMLLGQIDTQNPIEWTTMFNVNVLGLLNGMQAVLGSMKESRSGSIINISSIAGRKSFPNHAAYVGSKFAVSAMTENVREEVAEYGVRVMNISPGAVETELLGHTTSDEIKAGYEDWKSDMGGVLVAEDIANTAHFLYSQPQNITIREVVIAATKQVQ